MRKRRILFKTFVRPKEYEYKQDNCSYALSASHNLDPTNNNPLVICFSCPQAHCVTRGYMEECSPTLNAAASTSGNNRPFIVHKCYPINSMVIGKDGGNGDRQTFGIGEDGEPCPTIQTSHHHACAIVKIKKAYGIDQQGGKGGANFTEDVAPTICSDSHGTPHGVCLMKKRNPIVLNFQGSKGNNVVTHDGTCPTINSMHGHDVHVVSYKTQIKLSTKRTKANAFLDRCGNNWKTGRGGVRNNGERRAYTVPCNDVPAFCSC